MERVLEPYISVKSDWPATLLFRETESRANKILVRDEFLRPFFPLLLCTFVFIREIFHNGTRPDVLHASLLKLTDVPG